MWVTSAHVRYAMKKFAEILNGDQSAAESAYDSGRRKGRRRLKGRFRWKRKA